VAVAATHLSNRQGHNVPQLRELQVVAGSRAAPRLLVGDLNMPSTVLVLASRRGWPETGRGRTWPIPPPPSSWTISCATIQPGRSSPERPGWSPPLSATIVPWWSSSTSQPPDSRPTTRSVAWCSASIWSAPDGSALLRLGASSIQTDQEWSCRIVWMINGMIKPRG
jgi:hypothetical protein